MLCLFLLIFSFDVLFHHSSFYSARGRSDRDRDGRDESGDEAGGLDDALAQAKGASAAEAALMTGEDLTEEQEAAAMQQLMGFGQMVGQLVLDF